MEKTCKTCINNDDGLCDRRGILVEDEDSCEKHREDWRETMLRQLTGEDKNVENKTYTKDCFILLHGIFFVQREYCSYNNDKYVYS